MTHPINYAIQGIDVYHGTGTVDFEKVKNEGKKTFVFIKASMVRGQADPKFEDNWHSAKNAGLIRGAYHFMYHNHSAEYEADVFCGAVKQLEKGDLPPVLDIEINNPPIEKMRAWLHRVEGKLGIQPIIYASSSYYINHQLGEHFPGYKTLWIARYANHQTPNHYIPPVENWTFWQYKTNAYVPGVPRNTGADLNAFKGSESDFRQLLVK